MNQLTKAIELATLHHKAMLRTGTSVPYLAHLFNVCKLLAERNCSEELLAAALLHDVVEDTPVTLEQIEFIFGKNIAFLVEGATEQDKVQKSTLNETETWRQHKEQTIQFIKNKATVEQLLLIVAEKIDNIQTVQSDQLRLGEAVVWARFEEGKENQQWYYTSLLHAFQSRTEIQDAVYQDLVRMLEQTVNTVFSLQKVM